MHLVENYDIEQEKMTSSNAFLFNPKQFMADANATWTITLSIPPHYLVKQYKMTIGTTRVVLNSTENNTSTRNRFR